jgi:hypothetical protein
VCDDGDTPCASTPTIRAIQRVPACSSGVMRNPFHKVDRCAAGHDVCKSPGPSVACRSGLDRLAGQGLMGPGVGSQPTQGLSRRLAAGCNCTVERVWGWF